MKAYEIQEFGIDNLASTERPDPVAGTDEVIVKFHAASLNYRDYMVVTGMYNPRMKLPAIPLSDGAGEVVGIGSGVTKWKIGDRVMPIFAQRWFDGDSSEQRRRTSLGAGVQWDGVLREYAVFNEQSVVRIPEHLSFEEAATLPCAALTAWNALFVSGRVKPGETVLTLGTGGVSTFAAQFAKLAGARVISTSSSEEKIARLKELGVDGVINYREDESWEKTVLELTNGIGVDHVIEVGGSGTLAKTISAVRIGGHVAMIGALTGGAPFNPTTVFMKTVRLQGIFVGSRQMFLEMNKAISVSGLKPVIDRTFGFGEAREALKFLKNASHFGKVVVAIA